MIKRIVFLCLIVLTFGSNSFGQVKGDVKELQNVLFKTSPMPSEVFILRLTDKVDTAISVDTINANDHSNRIWPVLKETGYGIGMGILISFPSGLIAARFGGADFWSRVGAFGIGLFTGYVVGSSYGVYLAIKDEKPNVSFLGTLASGIAGAGAGLGSHVLSDNSKITGVLSVLLPIIFPIIYVEVFN